MAFFNKEKDNGSQNLIAKKQGQRKDFSEFWGPIMPTIRAIKNIGHALSALTEFVVLRQIFSNEASKLVQYGEAAISLLLAVSIALIIEIGISRFMPFVFRFFFRKKWNNWWSVGMVIPIIILVLPLCFIGTTMSYDGGFLVVDKSTATVMSSNLSKEDDSYEAQEAQEILRYQSKVNDINESYDKRIASNDAVFASKIGIQERKIEVNKAKQDKGHKWAGGHISNAKSKIIELKAEKEEKADEIEASRTNTLSIALDKHESKMLAINKKENKHLNKVEQRELDETASRASFVGTWGNIMSLIAMFAVIGVVFCIAVIEIYRAGAGQEYDKKIDGANRSKIYKYRKSLSAILQKKIEAQLEKWQGTNIPTAPAIAQANQHEKHDLNITNIETDTIEPTVEKTKPFSLPQAKPPAESASVEAVEISETQKNALQVVRQKYNPNSVRSNYKRSPLCSEPQVSDPEALERNRQKYMEAKAAYAAAGVEILELGNTISIRF